MIPIYAFSVFLWVCLSVQAPAQGVAVTIRKLSRTDNGTHFTFLVKFESYGMPVEAKWFKFLYQGYEYQEAATQTSEETALVINKEDNKWARLYLRLGDLKAHYWDVEWKLQGDGDVTISPDVTMSTIIPGTDVVHEPGTISQVTVRVDENRGEGIEFSNSTFSAAGQYYEDNVVKSADNLPFMSESSSSQNGVTTTTLSFGYDWPDPINGYASGRFAVEIPYHERANFPFMELEENIIIKVHHTSNSGPFPDDVVSVSMESPTWQAVWFGYLPSTLVCTARANDLEKVEIFKMNNGVEEQITAEVGYISAYEKIMSVDLNAESPTAPGDYICKAQSKTGHSASQTATVAEPDPLPEPVWLNSILGRRRRRV